jgi:hypothetical protein
MHDVNPEDCNMNDRFHENVKAFEYKIEIFNILYYLLSEYMQGMTQLFVYSSGRNLSI